MEIELEIYSASESSLIVYFGKSIDITLPRYIANYAQQVTDAFPNAILNFTPSYTSLLIEFHPLKLDGLTLQRFILTIEPSLCRKSPTENTLSLPTFYDLSTGPDLATMSEQLSLSKERIIEYHHSVLYTVCAIGFAPGFAFLADVPEKIRTPRLTEPRKRVPLGSVGIADRQTAVYPQTTPGGWNIIGNCPLQLYDSASPQTSLLKVGDKVQFSPINEHEFYEMGGSICLDW
ncbi:5-oxoprolinase subunit PxpB [Vibrio methylphosphonaticus]|uniref:5-oxoprolinase subunit PxpB n=1 Tax=Vibrio methylphosphonaticus TaxID=2946866 RepID=UPI00202AA835|nr:5-oxoprolinase subunit PxpB [Vibrio methylphosphonaticus]MCL9773209.1 5-oxoprolinase subunit PxpB [Vibrio methylphosphonaticus]